MTRRIVLVSEKIRLPSSRLNADFERAIVDELRSKVGTANARHGCFVRFVSLVRVVEAYVNSVDCANVFVVEYEAETFTPVVSETYDAVVAADTSQGQIVDIAPNVRAFLVSPVDRRPAGTAVSVTLTEISFRDGQFQCLSKICTER